MNKNHLDILNKSEQNKSWTNIYSLGTKTINKLDNTESKLARWPTFGADSINETRKVSFLIIYKKIFFFNII